MKNILLYLFLSLSACTLYPADNPLNFPLCVTVITNSYTEIGFSIEQITEKSDHNIISLSWHEKNSRCDAPFFRHFKEQWQLSKEQTHTITNLYTTQNKLHLAQFLYSLSQAPSVLLSSEVLVDDACTTW